MKTKPIYYAIQFVYVLLWACQLVVCHMTHSLIILTDSYINLYKILDISLGILHLGTQSELTKGRLASGERPTKEQQERPALAGRLFNRTCTYQFKRLPLLGAFVNGLFLAALLMSAAIEGIQTCVHSGHSQSPHLESLLHQHRLTYPLILLGFALVGLVMQHCSLKAHLMRDEELLSESLLDLRRHELAPSSADGQASKQKRNEIVPIVMRELNINQLGMGEPKRRSAASVKRQSYDFNVAPQRSGSAAGSSSRSQSRQSSLKELHDVVPNNCEGRISLRSLRLSANLESIVADCEPIRSVSRDLEASSRVRQVARASSSWRAKDKWFLVRYLASPLALLAYAAINYSLTDELLTEIADAFLSICVVFLLFAASYPPSKCDLTQLFEIKRTCPRERD